METVKDLNSIKYIWKPTNYFRKFLFHAKISAWQL